MNYCPNCGHKLKNTEDKFSQWLCGKKVSDSDQAIPCIWDSIPKKDWNKPMGISCPCPKCSPYSLGTNSITVNSGE